MQSVTMEQVLGSLVMNSFSKEQVAAFFAEKEVLTAHDILLLDISVEDRIHFVCVTNTLGQTKFQQFACWCAEKAQDIVRKYNIKYRGTDAAAPTSMAVNAAWAASWSAWYGARCTAAVANNTCWSETWDAADTAWDAALAAAWTAAWTSVALGRDSIVKDAAWHEMRHSQLTKLIELAG